MRKRLGEEAALSPGASQVYILKGDLADLFLNPLKCLIYLLVCYIFI